MVIRITRFKPAAILLLAVSLAASTAWCADWPMWGHDPGRRNFAPETVLPDNPQLLWTRELEAPRRAWPFQYEDYRGNLDGTGKLDFDVSYEPVVGGGRLFIASMVADRVTAYCTGTGAELWRYYADGPVRLAPAYREGKVYFGSDDGYLYCLDAASGQLLWRYRGGFAERRVLGNERLISIWPVRGGPVVKDGVVYFAAGVLPFEGIFIRALCAETGGEIWTSSTSGTMWSLHAKGNLRTAWSFGGPSPQGYLAVAGDKLLVPGGRTPPAAYDLHTGEFLYYRQEFPEGSVQTGGGFRVRADDPWFYNEGRMYRLRDGSMLRGMSAEVLTGEYLVGLWMQWREGMGTALGVTGQVLDREGELTTAFRRPVEDIRQIHFQTGSHLGFSRRGGRVGLFPLDEDRRPAEEISWEYQVAGEVWSMVPAHDRLFVISEAGKIYCFGAGDGREPVRHLREEGNPEIGLRRFERAAGILAETGKESGYAFLFGGDADLVEALAAQSDLHLVAVSAEPAEEVERFRRRLDEAGLYGRRAVVLREQETGFNLPPYLAELVVLSGGDYTERQLTQMFKLLRPYGGRLYLRGKRDDLSTLLEGMVLENGSLEVGDDAVVITRQGSLPGAGRWTHQYADAANRTYSDDRLVKPPLGTLWFGGPSNRNVLPRHQHGPVPQVAGGRLFILGPETLSARCVYTGRELWVREFAGIGHPFTCPVNEALFRAGKRAGFPHRPGALFIGSPYVSVEDGVYVIYRDRLLHLDPADGRTVTEFRLPDMEGVEKHEWGHLLVSGDLLVAAAAPQFFDEGEPGAPNNWNATSSAFLLVMDRRQGDILWTRRAEKGFRHNAIVAGNGRVYVVDGLSEGVLELLERRGRESPSTLYCLDINTGREIWRVAEGVFGTWLGYYEKEEILLQGGRHGSSKATLPDEPGNHLTAHCGVTGEIAWYYRSPRRYAGPLGLHRDKVVGTPQALHPRTGEVFRVEHPLTGEPYDWGFHRYYGCGSWNTSRYLVTFRSNTAGFADLHDYGGSGNLSGFRAGCTNNLVAADGVLNAPDYTRTCVCAYQLQASFGFIHIPETELWTFNRLPAGRGPVRALGINFNAPGNRREDGVLWLEYPKVYGPGPDPGVEVFGRGLDWFQYHATWIENPVDGYPWVASYGAEGVERITVGLVPGGEEESPGVRGYDLTFYFVEPAEDVGPGERVFDVLVQGGRALEGLDIVREAGGPRRVFKARVDGVQVMHGLEISFRWGERSRPAVISGVEIIRSDAHAIIGNRP